MKKTRTNIFVKKDRENLHFLEGVEEEQGVIMIPIQDRGTIDIEIEITVGVK